MAALVTAVLGPVSAGPVGPGLRPVDAARRPGDPAAAPVLSCRGLYLARDGCPAVADLSFDVGAGEAFGLVGPAGSGKSTAVRLVCGLLHPDAGEVRLGGRPAAQLDRTALRAEVGYVPQSVATLPSLTVAATVVLHARILGLAPSAAAARGADVLATVGLAGQADRPVQRCPGGVLREIGLAVALLTQPRLLVLDEPGTGLDPTAVDRLITTLGRLRDEGTALLYACRRAEEAHRLCPEVATLHDGRLRGRLAPTDRGPARPRPHHRSEES